MQKLKITGFILVIVAVLLPVISLLLLDLCEPSHKILNNESYAISVMRTIQSAQEVYEHRSGQFASDIQTLIEAKLLSESCINNRIGYTFEFHKISPEIWEVRAEPLIAGESGIRFFFLSSSDGEIRMNHLKPADKNSPSLNSSNRQFQLPEILIVSFSLSALLAGVAGFLCLVIYRISMLRKS